MAGYLNYSGRLFGDTADGTEEANADLANQELLDISEKISRHLVKRLQAMIRRQREHPGSRPDKRGGGDHSCAGKSIQRTGEGSEQGDSSAIIDNTSLSDAEKQDAVAQMVQMTEIAEQEVAIETLMATKGFSEAVVSLTEDSADVVVNAEELTDANRAQIEDIVTRKTEIAPENIVITPINE